jgi:hypothetical protein
LRFTEFESYFEPTEEERKSKLNPWIHTDPFSGKLTCTLCKMTYASKEKRQVTNLLQNHIEDKHLKIYAYPCHYCEKQFFSRRKRTDHIFVNHRQQHKLSKLG